MTTAARLLCAAALLGIAALPSPADEPSQPADDGAYLEKVEAMPDFCQTAPALGSTRSEGARWCGPAAVANAIVWLDQHGYGELIGPEPVTPEVQADVVRELASEDCMGTDEAGTPPKHVVRGIERYFARHGRGVEIETMGWRSRVRRIGRVPGIEWILRSARGNSNIVLNLGWYTFDPQGQVYQRHDGHYVTVAGYERHGDKVSLHVHDPA
ncbi:MAG TPA: hypothetical protein P5572_11695, partial [Phycisphaerae bacterium]|nr:hypothetical protein [Phycisphaerae bacterium]